MGKRRVKWGSAGKSRGEREMSSLPEPQSRGGRFFCPVWYFTFFMRVDGSLAFPSRDSFITQRGQVMLAVDHCEAAPKKIRIGRGVSHLAACYAKVGQYKLSYKIAP